MRVILTADLHYNHPRSKSLAEELISRINSTGGDVLVLIGDTGVADGDSLETCLNRFQFRGPKLFLAGNHELWTKGPDSYHLFAEQLPARIRALGWQWLETHPFITNDFAIVGTIGWYDYSFAAERLGIPKRFYAAKVSPGAVEHDSKLKDLLDVADDVNPQSREIIAKWNDGKFVKLGRTDEEFLTERLNQLSSHLNQLTNVKTILAAVHNVPFRELLPPPHSAQWDFAKAFLGSERIGQRLLNYSNIKHVFCGHSHLAMESRIGHIHAINIGSGYGWKTFHTLDV